MKNYDAWNELKKEIDARPYGPYCKKGEVWWCCFGLNIGSEQDGKNEWFERPVLVIKVLNRETVICIPLSSIISPGKDGIEISYDGKSNFALFQHVKTLSTKRFTRQISRLDKDQTRLIMIAYAKFLGFKQNETPSGTDGSLAGDHLVGTDGESRVLFSPDGPKGIMKPS